MVMDQFNNGTKACPCEPSCEEEVYSASVSSVTWPRKKYKVVIYILGDITFISLVVRQLSRTLPPTLTELTRRVCLRI